MMTPWSLIQVNISVSWTHVEVLRSISNRSPGATHQHLGSLWQWGRTRVPRVVPGTRGSGWHGHGRVEQRPRHSGHVRSGLRLVRVLSPVHAGVSGISTLASSSSSVSHGSVTTIHDIAVSTSLAQTQTASTMASSWILHWYVLQVLGEVKHGGVSRISRTRDQILHRGISALARPTHGHVQLSITCHLRPHTRVSAVISGRRRVIGDDDNNQNCHSTANFTLRFKWTFDSIKLYDNKQPMQKKVG